MNERTVRNWLIVGIIVVILAFIFVITEKKPEKQTLSFDSSLKVENYSSKSYVDTLVLVVLDKIFEYDSITVLIHDMPIPMQDETHSVAGFITRNPFQPNVYYLFVDVQNTQVSNERLVAHEMIHLRQYEDGRLKVLPNNKGMIFDGDTIIYELLSYENRPYEVEASMGEIEIAREMRYLIYGY